MQPGSEQLQRPARNGVMNVQTVWQLPSRSLSRIRARATSFGIDSSPPVCGPTRYDASISRMSLAIPPPSGSMLSPKQYRCSFPSATCRQMQASLTTDVVRARIRSTSSMGTTCPKCLTCCLAVMFFLTPFHRKSGMTSSAVRARRPFLR